MPCLEQAKPVFGGVAEYAGIKEKINKRERPVTTFLMN
jgi:hypothetical protein